MASHSHSYLGQKLNYLNTRKRSKKVLTNILFLKRPKRGGGNGCDYFFLEKGKLVI